MGVADMAASVATNTVIIYYECDKQNLQFLKNNL